MSIVFYISGHGFGHSTRQIEVMRAVRALSPDVRISIRTSTARWLFDATAPRPFEFDPAIVDTGLVQIDSLRFDEAKSAEAAADFYARFEARVEDEARALRECAADLVVSDVPPLASAAAARAGIPCVTIANFTWDWIYRTYDAFVQEPAATVIPTIERAYRATTLALRLPFHGGFGAMPIVEDIPLIARQSQRDPDDIRRTLGLDRSRPVVLASFSAYGADVPLDALERSSEFTILAPPREAPAGLHYEDLVAAADVVVSKPGYGIVSECLANDAALVYTARGRFPEYDVFVREMPAVLRCCHLPLEDLRAGRWTNAINTVLAMPAPRERPRIDGARIAAQRLLDAIH